MRKTLKSALSVVLSAAMVLTSGIGIDMKSASAKADSLVWSGSAVIKNGEWAQEPAEVKTDDGSTLEVKGISDNNLGVQVNVDLSAFDDPTIEVTATAGTEDSKAFGVCGINWGQPYVGVNDGLDNTGATATIPADQTTITGKLDKSVSDYLITAQGRTITKVVISDGDAEAPADPSVAPGDATEAPSEVPADPTTAPANGYTAHLSYADASWGNGVWKAGEANDAVVELKEGSATYTVSADNKSGAAAEGAVVFCVDVEGLYKAAADAGLAVALDDVSVKLDDTDLAVDKAKVVTGDIEEKGNYRIELYNEYGTTKEAPAVDTSKMSWSKSLAVTFTVNIAKASEQPTAAPVVPPTDGKPDFNATIKCFGNFYGWDSDTPTDATATVHVSDYGEYSVSFAAPDAFNDLNEMSGAFVVQTDLTGEPATHPFTLLAKTIKIGDTSYDWSKAVAYLDGDNIRMSARNEWGKEEEANPLAGQVIPINKDDVITFTFEVKEGAPTAPTEPTQSPEAPTEAPAQTYNAYLGFQTDVWDYRDEYEKDINSKDYDFTTQAMVGGEPTDVSKVKIENAVITDNGTYSVSMTGADLSGGTEFKMLYFSTDIPAAMKDVKFSDIKVIIDGAEVATLKDGVIKKEVQAGSKKYYMVMAVNLYGEEGLDLPESFTYTMPQNSVELQFTVSGLDLNQDYSTKTYGAKKGATFTSGNFKYKVTKAATITAGKTAKGKVEVVGLSAAGKKKTSVSVGTSVSYTSNKEKATYTISTLGAGAFKGASKLKAVTLSKNIKSIKKDTFKNCKNLAKLALKAKLSSVAKNSFKGCTKTIKVSGTSAKANVKKLVKSGYKKFK